MKKFLTIILSIMTILSLAAISTVKADEQTGSTSDWMPHRYVLSGYDIPTVMTYDDKSVTFSGSLNAGIATTGFNYLKAIDISNFQISMELDIPDIENLTWICMSFLDKNLVTDMENDTAPVAEPFNAMSGKGGYSNSEMTGLVLQLYTHHLLQDNVLGFDYVSKNLDFATGEKTKNGWRAYTDSSFLNAIKLNEKYDGKVKLTITSTEDGLAFNINDGAWTYRDEAGEFTQTRDSLSYDNTQGLKKYFSENDCYFAFVMMYGDENHRTVNLKVADINGMNPSDNKAPDYLGSKVVEKDNIKITVPSSAIGTFGVYPSAINGMKVVKYDEEDGDYEVVAKRATNLKADLVDYFRVVPQIDGQNLTLDDNMIVEYTLPEGYDSYKAYYINDDEETQAFPSSYVQVADGKMTLKVDNEIITKIAIYGLKNVQEPVNNPTQPTPTGNEGSNGNAKSGCFSSISFIFAPIAIASVVVLSSKKRREE